MTTEQKFDCVFCKENFDDKEALQIHFRKHGDPNFNPSTKNVTNEKSTDEDETVGCDVCDEVFPTIPKAITHKHKTHPYHDAKYFCPFCGKMFTMKHLYNKHIQSNHEFDEASDTKDFHCDFCKVAFYVPSAMMYHNKFFHRQDTELPAMGQSKKVKIYNQEMFQIYYCSFCGEEYNNKVNLHKHISDDHGDENHCPIEILRCPLCEAIFFHLDAYEVHLMFHSTEDLYSEKNEIAEKVNEFSLETVAPITEKVEEDVPDHPIDGIDNFLQLVMSESADNAPEKVKSKKHKKHKKSKKAAITLDEFLNMNKDVFGDGLDVQGIEEVPTQVVLKKAKGKKLSIKGQSKIVNADLAKLQKHGITVKTKSGARPGVANVKNNTENVQVNKTNVTNCPNEILSKLLNEGNSQIKIVKKSISQNDPKNDDHDTSNNNTDTIDRLSKDNKGENTLSDKEDVQNPVKENLYNISSDTANNIQADSEIINKASTFFKSVNNEISVENNTQSTDNDNTNSEKARPFIALPDRKTSTPTDENSTKKSDTFLPSSSTVISGKSVNETKRNVLVDYQIADNDETPQPDMDTEDHTKNLNENDADNNIANKTLNALKHLSHLITVKPLNQPKSPTLGGINSDKVNNENESRERVKEDIHNASISQHLSSNEQKLCKNVKMINNQITIKPSKTSSEHTQSDFDSDGEFNDYDECNLSAEFEELDEINSPNNNVKRVKLKIKNLPISQSKQIIKNDCNEIVNNETEHEDEFQSEENTNKGASSSSNIDILKRLTNVTAKSIPSVKNINKPTNIKIARPIINQVKETLPKNVYKTHTEVEIYNIDDSDSDGDHKLEIKQSNQTIEALRSLGKNITIKSNQQNIKEEVKDKKIINKSTRSDNMSNGSHFKFSKHSPDIQKSINLQNKLKSLGGNITVKSRNSPNLTNKEQFNFDEFDDEDEAIDSEPESNVAKIKITEVTEDDVSDNECPDSRTDAIVESPHASNSENEDNHNDTDEEFADLENEIKKSILKKQEEPTTSKKPPCLENFKHLNNLTIKSLKTKKNDSTEESNVPLQKEASEDTHNFNKQIAIKQLKNNIPQNGQAINKTNQSSTSINQTVNKNVSSSLNQVNTVKTVKKFQSQTVIEEITTTVTKTIRTMNQSSNEVVQSNVRPGPRSMIRPQKMFNRPQGPIRHTSPTVGTRIRNATPIRHATPSTVKPTNQLVPVRAVLNIQKGPVFNTGVRKIAPPKSSPQKPVVGKLKMSPHALNQATKRPMDEASGHFSCFKKPKESPMTSMDMADSFDDTVQYASATHSQSNFSSVTKTVKGKGMVTATQVRSEVSTSSQQQLSKLSNMSGLKIAKMSSKQTMQVEEKNISTATKNTLDALEKLQKQGLLVKKPRIDEYNDKSQSESDDDPS
ncbi:unnamed protein product, partial [Brenthis ino]